ncbi:MAG: hypothetical protein GY711_07005 [bacterium]|nr:hypothetical protein [bacterium]
MTKAWTLEDGPFGSMMILHSRWSSEAREELLKSGAAGLHLNIAKGWRGKDVAFVSEFADQLVAFEIIDQVIDDVSAVNDLGRLRRLQVNTYCKTKLDFANYPHLEDCSLEWRRGAKTLLEHEGVRTLFVNKFDGVDLRGAGQMRALESLGLTGARKLESLDGIENLALLRRLRLGLATKLASLNGLAALDRIERLQVDTCRKITDIASIGQLHELRELFLMNCGEIETLRPLAELRALETFVFSESTNIADGDLAPLCELPELRKLVFMDRAHYSHTMKEFGKE